MSAERQELFPDVPTLKEAVNSDWVLSVWRGVVAPSGLPADVSSKLSAAIEKAYNSEDYQSFMKERGFGLRRASGEEATKIVAEDDVAFGEIMKKAGLAKDRY